VAREHPRAALVVLALALLWSLPLHAAEPGETSSFQHHLVQGRFLLEEGQLTGALAEFEAAAEMPQARRNAELHYLLARVYYATDRVSEAMPSILRARTLAMQQGTFEDEMVGLYEFLVATFARVTVVGAGPEAKVPEPVVPILDPKLKRIYEHTVQYLRAPIHDASVVVYLPVAAYRLGGHIVELKAERNMRLDLRATTGQAASGVYGEGRSVGPPAGLGSLLLQLGVHGFYQQGAGGVGGRFQAGWMCRFVGGHLALRVAAELGLGGIERLHSANEVKTLFGISAAAQVGVGPVFVLSPRVALTPWFSWSVGYGHPMEVELPTDYEGPVHYLIHGPDLEVLFSFAARRSTARNAGAMVEPVVGLRVLFRESRPLGIAEYEDARPHLTVGGGVEFGLRIGG